MARLECEIGRRARLIGLVSAALISGIYATWFAQRPLYNWEILPYVAIALLDAGQPPIPSRRKPTTSSKTQLQWNGMNFCWAVLNTTKILTPGGQITGTWSPTNSKIFANQLPFYTVKPVYPALMSLFVRAEINPVTATMIISGAAYAAICFLLYVWISRWLNPAISLIITALLSLNPVLTPLAQLATPDALSVFVLLLGTFFVLRPGFAIRHWHFHCLNSDQTRKYHLRFYFPRVFGCHPQTGPDQLRNWTLFGVRNLFCGDAT